MSALNVLCAQLTRDLFAIAKFLLNTDMQITLSSGKMATNSAIDN